MTELVIGEGTEEVWIKDGLGDDAGEPMPTFDVSETDSIDSRSHEGTTSPRWMEKARELWLGVVRSFAAPEDDEHDEYDYDDEDGPRRKKDRVSWIPAKKDRLWKLWIPLLVVLGGFAIILGLSVSLASRKNATTASSAEAARAPSGAAPTPAPTLSPVADPPPPDVVVAATPAPSLRATNPPVAAPVLPPPTQRPTTRPTFEPTSTPTRGGCSEPDREVCQYRSRRGVHCGLEFEVFGSAANLIGVPLGTCMTNTATGFRAEWNPGDGNYLARKGVRPGTRNEVITYSADYQPGEIGIQRPDRPDRETGGGGGGGGLGDRLPEVGLPDRLPEVGLDNGFSLLGAYGWTQDPLVEFYVVDNWGIVRPPLSLRLDLGQVESDGGLYDLYVSYRVNKPSIEGTKSFPQFWSVRREPRTSGSITMANHFAAWAPVGYDIGRFFEVSLVAEGFNTIGAAEVNVTFAG